MKKEKSRMRENLIQEVCEKYGLSLEDATLAVDGSVFAKMLKIYPDFVGHISIATWAEDVFKEFVGIPTT